ncbi:hypothetical protein J2736_005501 [Paenibacillus qinlingensis]|uniref:Uncharacterized protein n=1 Tax=Paenibacillus qinlingensis TaxID=1837343 RepID=A0ABU1P5D7_9BACL|nr:hypothetical protein [Paenibacillus qinlingensis]
MGNIGLNGWRLVFRAEMHSLSDQHVRIIMPHLDTIQINRNLIVSGIMLCVVEIGSPLSAGIGHGTTYLH